MNQLIPLRPEDQERVANLREADLQEAHANRMQSIAREISERPNTLLNPAEFLEWARQARCNAAVLRAMARTA